MTEKQLIQIRDFSTSYYLHTDQFHNWDHIELVRKWSLRLAKSYPEANSDVLVASAYLHDIGRTIRDEGHPYESTRIALPFLRKIKLNPQEINLIIDAVKHHGKEDIRKAKSLEAKILFDADKLQIVSVFGFLRVLFWLIEERKMAMNEAVNFLFNYVTDVGENYLQTKEAISIYKQELPFIKEIQSRFLSWQSLE